jgi:hypothetical protein
MGATFGPIARDRFTGESIAIRDGNIKKEVEERLSGLNVFPLSIIIRP